MEVDLTEELLMKESLDALTDLTGESRRMALDTEEIMDLRNKH